MKLANETTATSKTPTPSTHTRVHAHRAHFTGTEALQTLSAAQTSTVATRFPNPHPPTPGTQVLAVLAKGQRDAPLAMLQESTAGANTQLFLDEIQKASGVCPSKQTQRSRLGEVGNSVRTHPQQECARSTSPQCDCGKNERTESRNPAQHPEKPHK